MPQRIANLFKFLLDRARRAFRSGSVGAIRLNPSKEQLWTLGGGDEVVVLTSYG